MCIKSKSTIHYIMSTVYQSKCLLVSLCASEYSGVAGINISVSVADMLTLLLDGVTKVLIYLLFLLAGLWLWFQITNWKVLRAAAKLPTTLYPLPIIGHLHYTLCGFESKTIIFFILSFVILLL